MVLKERVKWQKWIC